MQQEVPFFPSDWIRFLWDTPECIQHLEITWNNLRTLGNENPDKIICPEKDLIFKAFDLVSPQDVRVVLLGQDPYHGLGQAQGLSFSVPKTVKIPPSLRNIFKELDQTIPSFVVPDHGDLTHWATQGVLLLNSILTVFQSEPASHRKIGWMTFTDAIIKVLSDRMDGLVFLLWGNYAKKKGKLIDPNKHLILEGAHPSPLARGAFLGSDHFNKTNHFLVNHNKSPIKW